MTEPRLPTMEEMKEIVEAETLYKVAHIEDEKAGNYSSCFMMGAKQLKYVIGKVTVARSDSEGIYCYKATHLRFAQSHATHTAGIMINPSCVVLEVKPLGRFGERLAGECKPASVYVVGVYREKKEEYISPFKVGDRVRLVSSFKYGDYSIGCVKAGDVGQVVVVGTSQHSPQVHFSNVPVTYRLPKKYLEPTPEPEEEWVDVTRGCTLKFLHASACAGESGGEYIDITYKGHSVACLGLGGYWQSGSVEDTYKIELAEKGYLGDMSTFRILKRQ